MSLTDPIADMLTRLRNASRARHDVVHVASSRMKQSILAILKDEGFIEDFKVKTENQKSDLEVKLKYNNQQSVIRQLERVSRPGRRYYIKSKDLIPVRNNMGIAIISTPNGVMTGRQAKHLNLGGEYLCRVW